MKKYPECFGIYEPGEICDGGASEEPCTQRKECSAFGAYLLRVSKEPEVYLKELFSKGEAQLATILGDEEWEKLLKTCLRDYEENIKPHQKPKKKRLSPLDGIMFKGNVKPLRTNSSKPKRRFQRLEAVGIKHEQLWELTKFFFAELFKHIPEQRWQCESRAARVGQIYIVDKWGSFGYLSLYCRQEKGKDIALLSVCPKPGKMILNFQTLFTKDEILDMIAKDERSLIKFSSRKNLVSTLYNVEMIDAKKRISSILGEALGKLAFDHIKPIPIIRGTSRRNNIK